VSRRVPRILVVDDDPDIRGSSASANATLSKPLNSSLLRLTLQQVLTVSP